MRDIGSSLSPFNAFQIIQGLETLSLRMERHCSNAIKVADFLSNQHAISIWIQSENLILETTMSSNRYYKTLQSLLQRKSLVTGSLSLHRIRQISKLLNNPYNNYNIIHVAGTNGM